MTPIWRVSPPRSLRYGNRYMGISLVDSGPARSARSGRGGRVLVVDDEPSVRLALEKLLRNDGHQVASAASAEDAIETFQTQQFDAVISDIVLPGFNGIELLRRIREHNVDVPVVLITGGPRLETAMDAMRYGALRYLVKPVDAKELQDVMREAVGLSKMAVVKRQALALLSSDDRYVGDRASLEIAFERTLDTVQLHYQPIVRFSSRTVFAYEALLRPQEVDLPTPDALIDAAERLGWVHRMSFKVRELASHALIDLPSEIRLFVNLHALDLQDPELFAPSDPLSSSSRRVTFEVTERHSLSELQGIHTNVSRLKRRGFRVAIDDFGAGHAGLTSFAILEPNVIKLDMALIRDIDQVATKEKLVASMISVCKDLGVEVIAEGVERVGELRILLDLGCDLFQGYLFARPAKPFVSVTWPDA